MAWILLVSLGMTGVASAEDSKATSARCRELRAEARSTAFLYWLPQLDLAAVKPPKVGDISGTGLFSNQEFQLRAAVEYPVLDILRGNSVMNASEAECRRVLAVEDAENILGQGTAFGQAPALHAQIDVLTAGLPRLDALVDETKRRLARGIITVLDSDEIELRRLKVDTTLQSLRHDVSVIEAQSPVNEASALGDALRGYESAAMASRGERSFVRKLDAWHLDVQGGAIPYPQPDWYGMVSLRFDFGGVVQPAIESEALAAGQEVLKTDSAELRARTERFATAMRESARHLSDELALIDRQLALIDQHLKATPPESDRLRQALASFEVERLELQGRRAYVEKLRSIRDAAGRAVE